MKGFYSIFHYYDLAFVVVQAHFRSVQCAMRAMQRGVHAFAKEKKKCVFFHMSKNQSYAGAHAANALPCDRCVFNRSSSPLHVRKLCIGARRTHHGTDKTPSILFPSIVSDFAFSSRILFNAM